MDEINMTLYTVTGQMHMSEEAINHDHPWLDFSHTFTKKRDAIDFANRMVRDGADGSHAEVEKVIDFLWIHKRIPSILTVKKVYSIYTDSK